MPVLADREEGELDYKDKVQPAEYTQTDLACNHNVIPYEIIVVDCPVGRHYLNIRISLIIEHAGENLCTRLASM